MTYDFAAALDAWSRPPISGINRATIGATEMTRDDLRLLATAALNDQFRTGHADFFNFADTEGKHVLDFGCGHGLDALRYAWAGNEVSLADIRHDNIDAACALLKAHGHKPHSRILVWDEWPFFMTLKSIDVFHANGVLHHTPHARAILQRAAMKLTPDGEIRLMLYSDKAWRQFAGGNPPRDDTADHPNFATFVRAMDAVGHYADWYDAEKVEARFGDFLDIVRCEYINDHHLGVVLRPR